MGKEILAERLKMFDVYNDKLIWYVYEVIFLDGRMLGIDACGVEESKDEVAFCVPIGSYIISNGEYDGMSRKKASFVKTNIVGYRIVKQLGD